MKKKEVKEQGWCCWGAHKGFPTFPVIILVLGVFWLLSDMKLITTGVPWFPIILIIIAIGWIIDYHRKK